MTMTNMEQDYIKYVQSMRNRYPNLGRFCDIMNPKNTKNKSPTSRAAVVEMQERCIRQRRFDSPDDLDWFLQTGSSKSRRLYILESLEPSYVRVLGTRLRINPFVFSEQLLRGGTRKEQAAMLPSQCGPERSFTMHYVESRVFPDGQLNNLGASCTYHDRKIWVTKINSKFDEVAHVHRITSFWSRQEEDGSSNGLILVDPAVGDFIKIGKGNPKEIRPCNSHLYQKGYVDIAPFPCQPDLGSVRKHQPGPTRNSLFDDLLFYWDNHNEFTGLQSNIFKDHDSFAKRTSFFLRRIVASNWMQIIVYFDEIIDRLDYAVARADINVLDGVENHLSDVEFWHRRCRKSCEHLEQTMDAFQGSFGINDQPSSPRTPIYESINDFHHIYKQMCALQKRCQHLSQSLTHVVSVVQSKQAAKEAHSIRILTILGMLFVPLSFASGLFSMSDAFRPGERNFWVYFVTSLPLVGVVFSIAFAREFAEALRIKNKQTKSFLKVGLTARPADQGIGRSKDVEKGKN